jgi:hypothetical protein
MIDQYTNNPELTAAGTAADTATQTATQYQTAASMLPAALKDAINQKLDYNKDLINEKNTSMVNYFNAPSAARVQYQDIFNPFQREALVQQATNQAYLPYQNNVDILGQRLGSIQDIISRATGAFGANVTSAQGAAQLAADKYARLFGLAGAKSDVAYKQAQLAKSGSGDSGLGSLADILAILGGGGGGESNSQPSEPQPINPPPNDPQYVNTNWRSPEGQWEWNKQYQSWVPSGADVIE